MPRGSLAAVSGAAGSGKSTLLRGILGDPHLLTGKVAVHGSLAVVTQQPWLESGSIRCTPCLLHYPQFLHLRCTHGGVDVGLGGLRSGTLWFAVDLRMPGNLYSAPTSTDIFAA